MSKNKQEFKPKVEGKVGMYVCGVTAYDLHARVNVTFDLLYSYFRHFGYRVCYVRNFTDVDDKIIAQANELGEDPISLSRRYCKEFERDMILNSGYAYRIDGDVYFNIDKFPEYG